MFLEDRNKLLALAFMSPTSDHRAIAERFQLAFSNYHEQFLEGLTPRCPTMGPTVWFNREEIFEVLPAWPILFLLLPRDFISVHQNVVFDREKVSCKNWMSRNDVKIGSIRLSKESLELAQMPDLKSLVRSD
ncbi:hypothetical protein COOONC_00901 [Cooperia oncophora]